jgi:hypothetical protein
LNNLKFEAEDEAIFGSKLEFYDKFFNEIDFTFIYNNIPIKVIYII